MIGSWIEVLALNFLWKDLKAPNSFPPGAFALCSADVGYFRAGGKSVQLPCATSAAMPMLSPKVGCG
jgi:hypothetical protein